MYNGCNLNKSYYFTVIACSHASMSLLQEEIAEEPEYGDVDVSDDDDDRCPSEALTLFALYFCTIVLMGFS